MPESMSGSDLFNDLAHDFAERYRRGERPSPEEYAERYPELADDIRELFPALAMIERAGSEADRPPPSKPAWPGLVGPIPERLGDYRIVREIGRGGMGVVYEAVQESLGRHVALKVLHSDRGSGPVALIRFRRESKTAAMLHHSNIVPVFGIGEHDGVPYYAMQYIQGRGLDAALREIAAMRRETGEARSVEEDPPDLSRLGLATGLVTRRQGDAFLSSVVAGGKLPSTPEPDDQRPVTSGAPTTASSGIGAARPSSDSSISAGAAVYFRDVARMGRQAAEALTYAHAHGVVHRDIKPANLLLDIQGTIWVTDFGLAKGDGNEELTRPGDVVGTLRYLAPERFQGRADARSDIYGLGMTLYELLTLTPAFRGSSRAQLMHAILHDEPKRPRAYDPRIPRDLETIVLKAIAKDPADRFADAGEMAAELSRFGEGRPIRSRRHSLSERLWRWSRRNPALALLSLLAAALATMLVTGSVVAAWKFRSQRDAIAGEQLKTQENLERAKEAERRSETQRGQSLALQARDLRLSGRSGRRSEGMTILAEAAAIARRVKATPADLDVLRDETIATLGVDDVELDDVRPAPTLSDQQPISFAVEADRYVLSGRDGSFHVYRLSDQSEIRVVRASRTEVYHDRVLSASGRFLAAWAAVSGTYPLWDLDRGDVPAGWPRDVLAVTFRGDGAQLAIVCGSGDLRVYDLPAMVESARVRLEFAVRGWINRSRLALSGDGRRAAVIIRGWEGVAVYDLASRRLTHQVKIPTPRRGLGYGELAMDHAGTLLAFAHDRAITVHDVSTGDTIARLEGHAVTGDMQPTFQPKGHLLLTSGRDGKTRLWDPIRGRPVAALAGGFVGWLGEGSRLAIATGRDLVVHRVARSPERRTIDARTFASRPGDTLDGPARVEYSPDGRLIALPLWPEGVWLVRSSDGVPLALLPIGRCDEVAFLPNGDLVTYNGWGLCRWPVRPVPGRGRRIGSPEPLSRWFNPTRLMSNELAVAASGGRVGTSTPRPRFGSVLLDPSRPGRRTWIATRPPMGDLAISRDARWAVTVEEGTATATPSVQVWDASTGRLLRALGAGPARVAFSPDGSWLGVGESGRYRFYRSGSWEAIAEVKCEVDAGAMPLAFHPRGRLAAVLADATRGTARLVDVEKGRVLATFEPPEPAMTYAMAFSPDGRFLAMSQTDQRVHIWDLVAIHSRLDRLGLAAGFPELSADGSVSASAPVAESNDVPGIEVVGADEAAIRLLATKQVLREGWLNFRRMSDAGLEDPEDLCQRAYQWKRLGRPDLATADYRASLARRPESVTVACDFVRHLLDLTSRDDMDEAVRWSQKAVALNPGLYEVHYLLSESLFRAGRYAEAADELVANVARMPSNAGFIWLRVAACRQRLGQTVAARAALAEAVRWRAARPEKNPSWAAFFEFRLREVQSALSEPLPDLPADVFAH